MDELDVKMLSFVVGWFIGMATVLLVLWARRPR